MNACFRKRVCKMTSTSLTVIDNDTNHNIDRDEIGKLSTVCSDYEYAHGNNFITYVLAAVHNEEFALSVPGETCPLSNARSPVAAAILTDKNTTQFKH